MTHADDSDPEVLSHALPDFWLRSGQLTGMHVPKVGGG